MSVNKIKHKVDPITTCHYCSGEVKFVCNDEIYGRTYGDWPYAYLCQNNECRAYVGVHSGTEIPLGSLADKDTREARKYHKASFLRLLKVRNWNRNGGYAWLSKKLDLPRSETHWGMFDAQTCMKAGEICRKAIKQTESGNAQRNAVIKEARRLTQ